MRGVVAELFKLYEERGYVVHRAIREFKITGQPTVITFSRRSVFWKTFSGVSFSYRFNGSTCVYVKLQDRFRLVELRYFPSTGTLVVASNYFEDAIGFQVAKSLAGILGIAIRGFYAGELKTVEVATQGGREMIAKLDDLSEKGVLEGPYVAKEDPKIIVYVFRGKIYGKRFGALIKVYKGEEFDVYKVEAVWSRKFEKYGIVNDPMEFRNVKSTLIALLKAIKEINVDEVVTKYAFGELLNRLSRDPEARARARDLIRDLSTSGRGVRKLANAGLVLFAPPNVAIRIPARPTIKYLRLISFGLPCVKPLPSPSTLAKKRVAYIRLLLERRMLRGVLALLADRRSRRRLRPYIVRRWWVVANIINKKLGDIEERLRRADNVYLGGRPLSGGVNTLDKTHADEEPATTREGDSGGGGGRGYKGNIAGLGGLNSSGSGHINPSSSSLNDPPSSRSADSVGSSGGDSDCPFLKTALEVKKELEEKALEARESPVYKFLEERYRILKEELKGKRPAEYSHVLKSEELARRGDLEGARDELLKVRCPVGGRALRAMDSILRQISTALREERKKFEKILEEAQRLIHEGRLSEAKELLISAEPKTFSQWRRREGLLRLLGRIRVAEEKRGRGETTQKTWGAGATKEARGAVESTPERVRGSEGGGEGVSAGGSPAETWLLRVVFEKLGELAGIAETAGFADLAEEARGARKPEEILRIAEKIARRVGGPRAVVLYAQIRYFLQA